MMTVVTITYRRRWHVEWSCHVPTLVAHAAPTRIRPQ